MYSETYVKGQGNSTEFWDRNPENSFDSIMECMVARCAADRTYQAQPSFNGWSDQTGFTNGSLAVSYLTKFPGATLANPGTLHLNQHFENSSAVPIFHAVNAADLMFNRWAKYILQPALNTPDYQYANLDCSARAGSYGDILFCWNASDGPETVTFNLSPFLQSGQQIIEQTASAQGPGPISILSVGTASATVTLPGTTAIFLVFPKTFASELSQPAISARLSDVTNAADTVVRFSYDPYWLDVGATYDCGTGTCTPSWDRNIGPIWYRILYLRSDGSVCASSDIEQL